MKTTHTRRFTRRMCHEWTLTLDIFLSFFLSSLDTPQRFRVSFELTLTSDGLLTIYITDTAVNALLFHFGRSLTHRLVRRFLFVHRISPATNSRTREPTTLQSPTII